MTDKSRKILYYFFVFLFLIITPFLFIYASGYKISSGFNFEKTGVLVIDSKPEGAKIYINDKLQVNFLKRFFSSESGAVTSPARVQGLVPGEYKIRIEKGGYWDWEKRLKVEAGESTFAEEVVLFKKDLPMLIIEGECDGFEYNENKNIGFFINEEGVDFVRVDIGDKESVKTKLFEENGNISWSPRSKKVIIGSKVLTIDNLEEVIDLGEKIENSDGDFKWGNNNDKDVYYLDSGDLHLFDLNNLKSENVLKGSNVLDFKVEKGRIFTITRTNDEMAIVSRDKNSLKILKTIKLPDSSYQIFDVEHDLINLLDIDSEILYLIDMDSNVKPFREIIGNVKKVKWMDGSSLLFANDFEVWMFNLETYSKTLITRVSKMINSIDWYSNKDYVIFSTDESINIVELDDREKRNIQRVVKGVNIKDVNLSKDKKIIYFCGELKDKVGLYKLQIQ